MNKKQKNIELYNLKKKSKFTAVGASLLIIGVGSMYSGKVISGLLQMVVAFILWMFFMGWIMWIVSPMIAYSDATRYNKTLALELDLKFGVDVE